MNLINIAALTMSSREIAELLGSRHDSVKRAIERLAEKRVILQPPMVDEPTMDSLGRPRTESVYHVSKRDSFVVVAQLSPEFTAALVDRWQQLEQRLARPAVPENLPDALRLAADLAEQKAVLALENQQQAATIASLESLFMTGETPTQFCKRLNGVNSSKVNSSLLALGWLYNAANDERSKPRYRVASRVRDCYLTERPRKIGAEGDDPFIKYDLILLLDGAKRLHKLYMAQKLAMKATWNGEFTQAKYSGETLQ